MTGGRNLSVRRATRQTHLSCLIRGWGGSWVVIRRNRALLRVINLSRATALWQKANNEGSSFLASTNFNCASSLHLWEIWMTAGTPIKINKINELYNYTSNVIITWSFVITPNHAIFPLSLPSIVVIHLQKFLTHLNFFEVNVNVLQNTLWGLSRGYLKQCGYESVKK